MIEQTDMRQDRPQTAVGMRQIILQSERPLQLRDGFDMLEILRWTPHQERLGYMAFRQSRIEFQSALAVELCLLQPFPGRVSFEMAFRAYQRKNRVCPSEEGIASDRIHERLSRLLKEFGVAGRTQPVALNELGISHRIPAVAGTTLRARFVKRTLERPGSLSGDLVNGLEWTIHVKNKLFYKTTGSRMRVEQFN